MTEHSEPAVSDLADFIARHASWDCKVVFSGTTERMTRPGDAAEAALSWLRSLPIEERCALIGLERAPGCWYYPAAGHAYTSVNGGPNHDDDRPLWVGLPEEASGE